MASVAEIMQRLPDKFQPHQAEGLEATFQIRIEEGECFQIQVADSRCLVEPGEHPDPDVTLIMTAATFSDIIGGRLGGTSAFLGGTLRAEGNVMLATRLSDLFRR